MKVVTNRERDFIMGHIFFVAQQVSDLDFAIPSQAQGLTSQLLDTQIPTNMFEDKWPTPVKIQVLKDYLLQQNYDSQEIEYLVDGFSVFSEKLTAQVNCTHLRSALERPDIVKEKICKELLAGRVAGPFLHRPCENINLSPLGLCPKKENNKFRLIFHLSHSHGDSMNDFIPQEFSTGY